MSFLANSGPPVMRKDFVSESATLPRNPIKWITRKEIQKMRYAASAPLRWVYSLVVLSAVLPVGLAASSWVGLARGSVGALAGLPVLGPLLFLALGLYRIYLVARVPGTLSFPQVRGFPSALRRVGIFALYAGAVIAILNWFAGPLMRMFMTQRTESGVEFFVAGMYLSMLGGIGVLGLVVFELSRLIGFERQGEGGSKKPS